jgi:citrate lyase subunit beta/citryl-CoA lyase
MSEELRRSLLYVPASAESMVRKAGSRGADVIILDLEDGVVPEAKDQARDDAERSLTEIDFGAAEVFVRANPPSSPWGEGDLEMLARARPQGVVCPKVEDAETVASVDAALGGSTPLYLMIETVDGVLSAPAIARSSPRVGGLFFGAADYRESLRAGRHPDELELHFARCQILHAARSAGVEAFDTPWFEYRDSAGLRQSAWRVRRLGFDGKTAIHPAQIELINQAFSPSPEEVTRARRVAEAMAEAIAAGRYVATVDGEMVEALHLKAARRTLDQAYRLGLTDQKPPPELP